MPKINYRNAFTIGIFLIVPTTILGIWISTSGNSYLIDFLILLWIACYIQIQRAEIATVPETEEWTIQPDASKIHMRTEDGYLRYSHECACFSKFHKSILVPDRSHYHSKLGGIVLKMDHYCPWLGTTICVTNYRCFHQLLFYSIIIASVILIQQTIEVYSAWHDESVPWCYIYIAFLGVIHNIAVIGASAALYFLHVYLILNNITMIEWMQKKEIGFWNTGSYWRNFCHVYTSNPIYWFFPIIESREKGLYFEKGVGFPKNMPNANINEETVHLLS